MIGPIHAGGLLILLADLVVLAVVIARPLRIGSPDDRGDGRSAVVLPRPRPAHGIRVVGFYLVSAAIVALFVEWPGGLATLSHAVVARFADAVVDRPIAVASYVGHLDRTIPLVVVANICSLALTMRASAGRRIVLALNAVLFAFAALTVTVVAIVVAVLAHLPTAPATLTSSLLILLISMAIMLRMQWTTFQLPRPTAVPVVVRPDRRKGMALLLAALAVAVAVVMCAVDAADGLATATVSSGFVLIFGFPLIYDGVLAFLMVATRRIEQPVSDARPAITVITPAFNEEAVIAATLEAIDRAAGAYGGPVTSILVDDGSSDRTVEVVQATMGRFEHAVGVLVRAPHGGKAAALNNGLSRAASEIVVRIDADTIIDELSFVHLPGWFEDPTVGMVGALDLPNLSLRSWYARGRLFECLSAFAFARTALGRIDAINCVPGTFMAFRASPARSVGGFVSGMNGEDADLTLLFGRLGYHVMIDTRIRIYEDVPGDLKGFREQRVRWNRAGVQIFARHSPIVTGPGTAREWFYVARGAKVRATAMLRPLVVITALELLVLNPTTRHSFPLLVLAYLASSVPTMLVLTFLAVRFGFARRLGWLVVWYPFTIVRRVIAVEALLTLPTRPAIASLPAPVRDLAAGPLRWPRLAVAE